MKIRFSLLSIVILAAGVVFAADNKVPAPTEAETMAKARATYPLKTCVVTDEALTGEAVEILHREAGKPDRLIRFCCEGCIEDFKADPAKFLKKIDDAAKAEAGKKKS